MAADDGAEPVVLHCHRRVHPMPHFDPQVVELAGQPLPVGPSLHHETPLLAARTDMRETEKGERLGIAAGRAFSFSSDDILPELKEARLVLVERELELAQALAEVGQHMACICLVLGAHHESSCPGGLRPRALPEPDVKLLASSGSSNRAPRLHASTPMRKEGGLAMTAMPASQYIDARSRRRNRLYFGGAPTRRAPR